MATIPVTGAWFVAVNPAAKLAYVTSQPQQIDVIDTTTNSVVNTFTAGSNTNVGSLSADPVNSLLYVASTPIGGNLQYSISVLNATTGTLLGTTTALGVVTVVQALSPARDAVVTGGKGSQQGYTLDRIFINGSTYNTMKTLQVGKNPGAIGYNQATKFLYVANGADNTVSVISY